MHKSWCPLPWLSQNIRNNGDMRICDHTHHGPTNGLLRKTDNTVYNARTDDIHDARNSDLLKSVRRTMLAGEWHAECRRCMMENASGLSSRNQNETKLWSDYIDFETAKSITSADGSISTEQSPIRHYGVRFGNKCNQKCRSCGPSESDFWYDDYVRVWNTHHFKDSQQVIELEYNDTGRLAPNRNIYDWYEADLFWDHIRSNAHNIRMIHMVGGEPMLIDQQYRFLSLCIELDIAKDITVEYNSNILKIPDKAWSLWPKFKEVRIGASVDGIDNINEYIRYPSKWSAVVDHLDRFDSDSSINFNVWIASTVMIYNIYYMPEMLEWFLDHKFNRLGWTPGSPLINFHPLYKPSFLCARALPEDVKHAVVKKFQESKARLLDKVGTHYQTTDERYHALMDGISKHLDKWAHWLLETSIEGPMEKFWSYTNRLDAIRGEDMSSVMPEWHAILQKYR